MSINKVVLIGNLSKEPELSQLPSDVSLCKFSIAVSRKFAGADGSKETDFFNIVVWRALAENCQKYLKKGNKVCVIGSIQNRSYDTKDGTKKYTTDIVAEEVEFLVTNNFEEEKPKETPKQTRVQLKDLAEVDEDLPF